MKNLIGLLVACSMHLGISQPTANDSLIKVSGGGFSQINEALFPGAVVYAGTGNNQVYVQHKGIQMWCDRAVFYRKDNFIRIFDHVRMNQGDSIKMSATYAEYNGKTEFAFASGHVEMNNPGTTLTTDSLFFDRSKQQAYYRSGGTVTDTASTLKSRIGRYFIAENRYQFLENVTVTNPEYTIDSDHLNFYTETGHAYMYGPSIIKGTTSTVYCERGFYDTRADEGYFIKNSRIDYNNRTVTGDSLYFNRGRSFASATNNIVVTDTINKSIIKGHYAEVYRAKDSVFITKRAVAISVQEQDSVYIHADTLMVTGPADDRIVRGFYDVRLFKSDLSGRCDSIITRQRTGLTKMITQPVLWSGNSQMTGDSIHIQSNTKTERLDSLHVFYNAFIIDQDSSGGFNQIKGKELLGKFNDSSALEVVHINKNVENLIYSRNEQQQLIGINKGTSGRMEVLFEAQEMSVITTFDHVEDITYPPEELPENARTLRGFIWRGDEIITTKEGLFKGQPVPVLPAIQGIPLPKIEEDFFKQDQKLEINKNSRLKGSDLQTRASDTADGIRKKKAGHEG
ncbi:OstA-like protein [Nonlabens sp.]|uniref:OstA-like protein n=1 Tax=Nonlabens sp. TaxID=1888209 RepID=UPI0025DA3F4D|nr:OstA-like protein [Nonlabens sp.]